MNVRVRDTADAPNTLELAFTDIDHVGPCTWDGEGIEWVKIDDDGWLLVTVSEGYTAKKIDDGSGSSPALDIVKK